MLPVTVQIPVVRLLKITGCPEAPPVALRIPVPLTVTLGAVPKVMVWLAWLLKLAVALFAAAIVSVQLVLAPLHAPLQPVKALPLAGVAVSVIGVPLAKE
jgi:hypothetical protein